MRFGGARGVGVDRAKTRHLTSSRLESLYGCALLTHSLTSHLCCSSLTNFGLQIIYVMLNEMVFRVNDDQLNTPDSWRYILPRHISYFADEDSLNGLLQRIGEENPFYQRFIDLAGSFGTGNPRQPFESWEYVEEDLRDLVGKLTNLDPRRRITASEALQHPWFSKAS